MVRLPPLAAAGTVHSPFIRWCPMHSSTREFAREEGPLYVEQPIAPPLGAVMTKQVIDGKTVAFFWVLPEHAGRADREAWWWYRRHRDLSRASAALRLVR
jgi:hypothetical protein